MQKITYSEFLYREYDFAHAPYAPEMTFYKLVSTGEEEAVAELCSEPFHKKPGLGVLSKNELQNIKYHFAISAGNIARECIRSGLPHIEAYRLSDYYIQIADETKSLSDLSSLHTEMCGHYTRIMKKLQKKKRTSYSRPISLCINYIYDHLNTRITIKQLAATSFISEAYLSRLFKKETGYTISEYILSKKIETAKSMLSYSCYSIAEIAAALAFPTQSYMTNVFKKDCGMTPKQFRENNHFV